MNKWANNYYTQGGGVRSSPRPPRGHATARTAQQGKKGNTGVVDLCVYRVAHLTQLTLKSFIERQGVQVLNIEQASHKGAAYRSFLVRVREKDASKLLSRSFWPGLVACQPWLEGDEQWHYNVFSRRSVRGGVHASLPNDAGKLGRYEEHVPPLQRGVMVKDQERTVAAVACSPQSIERPIEKKGKQSKTQNPRRQELESDREYSKLTKKPSSRKNGISGKKVKSSKNKINKGKTATAKVTIVKTKGKRKRDRKKPSKKEQGRKKNHDEEKRRWANPVTPKNSSVKLTNNKKTKSAIQVDSDRNEKMEGKESRSNRKKRRERDNSQRTNVSAASKQYALPFNAMENKTTVNEKYPNHSRKTQRTNHTKNISQTPHAKYTSWTAALSGMLIQPSEEAVDSLLGPIYDRLLAQDDISDDELFLGLKVLAYCARATVSQNKFQQLLYRILQPQVISLLKEFAPTIVLKYPERAERYFWDLAEFLDLYIVHNVFIPGMLDLFTTCLSQVLSLKKRNYVTEDLVKVYRTMQVKVFT